MISRNVQWSVWRVARATWRWGLGLATVAVVVTLAMRWYRGIESLEDTRPRLLLTVVGLVGAGWLSEILAAGARRSSRLAVTGAVAVVASLAFYLTLVWTEWKPYAALWRAWWLAVVAAVALAHVVWARLLTREPGRWYDRVTPTLAALLGAMVAVLALRPNLLDDMPLVFVIVLAGVALAAFAGSFALWLRWRRSRTRPTVSRWQKVGWVVTAQAAIFGFGFYTGRATSPTPSPVDMTPSALAHLTPAELDEQVAVDLSRLKVAAAGIDDLGERAAAFYTKTETARQVDGRAYYLPSEEDELRAQFMTYLAYRAALLRLVATYAGFESVARPEARARCFLVGYGAGTAAMRAGTMVVATYGKSPSLRRKLNEADDACGLRSGEFDRIEEAVTATRNKQVFEQMAGYFETHRRAWRDAEVLPVAEFDWAAGRIDSAVADVRARAGEIARSEARFKRFFTKVQRDVSAPVYDAQSVVSTLIGDTRIVKRPPFIRHEQVVAMQGRLQPGDILLERRNWFMSNAFLPGFWPHAALYVGTADDLQKLGLAKRDAAGRWTSDYPAVAGRLDAFVAPAHDGQANTVIESVSEGVIFNSLTESMGADYVAVLRPRLTDAQKAAAIARAFGHQGKPYDFEFDFFSADKLVCTELVYRSYHGMLRFDLVRIMGRDTLPALEICRKFAAERASPGRELDFVMFLDAVPREASARLASEDDFCASAKRPRGFNE